MYRVFLILKARLEKAWGGPSPALNLGVVLRQFLEYFLDVLRHIPETNSKVETKSK